MKNGFMYLYAVIDVYESLYSWLEAELHAFGQQLLRTDRGLRKNVGGS